MHREGVWTWGNALLNFATAQTDLDLRPTRRDEVLPFDSM